MIDYIKANFGYCPDCGEVFKKRGGEIVGWRHRLGYREMQVGGPVKKSFLVHRVAWLLHYGCWPSTELDHINLDKSDNRIVNLRTASRSENLRNRRGWSRSGLPKGVSRRSDGYVARIKVNGKTISISTHKTADEAHRAYLAYARLICGEFARS